MSPVTSIVETNKDDAIKDVVEWTLAHGVAFRTSPFSTTHTPFALTPTPISKERFQNLKAKAGLLGKLVHAASEDEEFLATAIEPIIEGDYFFRHMWEMNQQLKGDQKKRSPLLIMRSDFMDDETLGPKLIEFNGIAAGMQPFGQKVHELHSYLQSQWADVYNRYSSSGTASKLVDNHGIDRLADGIAEATSQIKREFNDPDPPRFLMIVQANEDNVYDQHLLEYALRERGITTIRKTFKQIHGKIQTGEGDRMILEGVGTIDTVYLRAGYLHQDYYAKELDGDEGSCHPSKNKQTRCCQSLIKTRVLIEKHRVAMNATVNQQLASSKRVQTLLSAMPAQEISARFGLTLEEATAVKDLLGENWPVTADSVQWFEEQDPEQWVLKNQGEGGGHAVMGSDILPKLQQLTPDEYPSWSLMRRLRPAPRSQPTLLVRKGEAMECEDLISEIGIFTVHIDGMPPAATSSTNEEQTKEEGYTGYLIRSKPSAASEGGVHSGLGVLDSLVYL